MHCETTTEPNNYHQPPSETPPRFLSVTIPKVALNTGDQPCVVPCVFLSLNRIVHCGLLLSGFPCSAAHLAVKHVVPCSFSLPHACCVIFCCVQKPQLIQKKAELAPQVLLWVCLHMFWGTRAQISVGCMLTNCSWPLIKMNWWRSLPGDCWFVWLPAIA